MLRSSSTVLFLLFTGNVFTSYLDIQTKFFKSVFGEDSWITTFHCSSMKPPKRCFAKYFDWPVLYYFVFFYLEVQKDMFFRFVFSTFFSRTRNCFAAGHPMLTLKPHQREYHCLLKFRIDCKWRIPCLANSVELNALVEKLSYSDGNNLHFKGLLFRITGKKDEMDDWTEQLDSCQFPLVFVIRVFIINSIVLLGCLFNAATRSS